MPTSEEIPIEKLMPNPRPIRSELKLTREFVADVRKEGVRVPLIVRPLKGDKTGMYEIVAGMRRYETALKIGARKLPCIVRELDDEQAYFETLRENIHREDVNPADLAESIRRGRAEMNLSTDKIAESLSMEKSEIEMWLKIAAASDVMARLREGKVSKEHASEIIKALAEIDTLRASRRLTPEAGQRLRIDIMNHASRTTVPDTKRFISNQLRQYRPRGETQTSIAEALEELTPHDKAVERISADFASKGAMVETVSFRPDLMARLSPELKRKYGCDHLWVEVVDTNPPTHDKMRKLHEILGSNWRIMVYDLKANKETLYP